MSAVPATNSRAAARVTKYHGKSLPTNRDRALRTAVRKLVGLEHLAAPRRIAAPDGLCCMLSRCLLVEGHELGHGVPVVAAATVGLVAGTAEVKAHARAVASCLPSSVLTRYDQAPESEILRNNSR